MNSPSSSSGTRVFLTRIVRIACDLEDVAFLVVTAVRRYDKQRSITDCNSSAEKTGMDTMSGRTLPS